MQITSVASPKYATADGSVIDCVIGINGSDTNLPFTAKKNAPVPHEAALYEAIERGDHGPIQPYQGPDLSTVKAEHKARINRWRQQAEQVGFSYDFPDGSTGTVQTRERDMINVIGLSMGAQASPGETFEFRDGEDVTHQMTGAEVVALGAAAQAFITSNYKHSWNLKGQVDQAQTAAQVEAITWES